MAENLTELVNEKLNPNPVATYEKKFEVTYEKGWLHGYEEGFQAGYEQRMEDELREKDTTSNEEHF